MYDAANRRFMAIDPIKDGWNWSAYVNNNPIKYIDPTGLFPALVVAAAIGAAKAAKAVAAKPAVKAAVAIVAPVVAPVVKYAAPVVRTVARVATSIPVGPVITYVVDRVTSQTDYYELFVCEDPGIVEKTGQIHHVISNRIFRELNDHDTLKGVFNRESPQFKIQAVDRAAHIGYQDWHRAYDHELENWLINNPQATPQEFIDELNRIYNTPEMIQRFGRVTFSL